MPSEVYVVFALDIFQSVVIAALCWHTLVSGWGRGSALIFPGWTFIALPIVSGIGKYLQNPIIRGRYLIQMLT